MISIKIRQLGIGIILTYFHLFAYAISGIFILPLILQKLGMAEYGIYSLAYSTMAYMTILDLGFFNTAIRYISEYKAKSDWKQLEQLLGMLLIIYGMLSVIILLVTGILYFNVDAIFHRGMTAAECAQLRSCLIVIGINVALTFPLSVFKAATIAYERFALQRGLEILRLLTDLLLVVILLFMGYRVFSLVFVAAVCNIAMLFVLFIYCLKKLHLTFCFSLQNKDLLKRIFSFSICMFIIGITNKMYWNSGQLILGIFSGAAEIGYFALGVQICLFGTSISGGVTSVFLPWVTRMTQEENAEKKVSELFIKVSRIQFFINAIILIGFIVFGRQFFVLWVQKDDSQLYWITLLLLISTFLPNAQGIGNTILEARNHIKIKAVIFINVALLAIILQVLLCKKYAAMGCTVAIAVALTLGLVFAMNYYYKRIEKLDVTGVLKQFGKLILPLAGYACVAYYLFNICFDCYYWFSFLIGGGLFTVGLLAFITFFLLNMEEKNLLFSKIGILRKFK